MGALAEVPASEAQEGPASPGEEEVPVDEDHFPNPRAKASQLEGRHCIRCPNTSDAPLALESDPSTTATWLAMATARAEGRSRCQRGAGGHREGRGMAIVEEQYKLY